MGKAIIKTMTRGQRFRIGNHLTVALLVMFELPAQPKRSSIEQRLREEGLCLVDLRGNGYYVAYPNEPLELVQYNPKFDYIDSIIAPGGRSLFTPRRIFGEPPQPRVEDILIRRSLKGSQIGPEENVDTPFIGIFQFAVSEDEKFMVVAGRLRNEPTATYDAIFLFNKDKQSVEYVAPYASLNNGKVRSLNVSNGGNLVVYEDDGTIRKYERSNTHLTLTDHHPGQLPVLMPNGHGYIYANHGELLLNDGSVKRLLPVSNIVGAIRVSPNGEFVAFGEDPSGHLGLMHLRVCDLESKACVEGREYSERIPGRETYWLKR
jgi:hypothetical protein